MGSIAGCGAKQGPTEEPLAAAPPPICAVQSPELCLQDGLDLLQSGERDAAQAKFELACTGGSLVGCTYLADLLYTGDDAARARAYDLFAHGCDAGEMMACAQLGGDYLLRAWALQDGGGDATAAFVSANELLRRACVTDEPEDSFDVWGVSIRGIACGQLATSYEHGHGVPVDLRMALDLNVESCEFGWPRSCAQVGFFYDQGRGVDADRGRAVEMFERACTRGDAMGCYFLGVRTGDRDALQRACEAQYPESCEALAEAP